jgi:5'-methylthioadenosine phosphorylase
MAAPGAEPSEERMGDIDSGKIEIGVIGGSGLYRMGAVEVEEERRVETPFGEPSDVYVIGRLAGKRVAFLPRHGRGHRLLPSEIDFRANVFGFKVLGVERLLSVSAVGSMQQAYAPGHVVVPDQFIDRTRHRPDTFFGDGLVAHVSFADPICPTLAVALADAATAAGATVHRGGTYLCMEGPQFSTRAESHLYRSWGVDVIGMTNLQEAKLAREAEICYATLAMVTDYDCWHESEEAVSVEAVLAVLAANAALGEETLRRAVEALPERRTVGEEAGCGCGAALTHALLTDRAAVPAETVEKLRPLIGRAWST